MCFFLSSFGHVDWWHSYSLLHLTTVWSINSLIYFILSEPPLPDQSFRLNFTVPHATHSHTLTRSHGINWLVHGKHWNQNRMAKQMWERKKKRRKKMRAAKRKITPTKCSIHSSRRNSIRKTKRLFQVVSLIISSVQHNSDIMHVGPYAIEYIE